MHYFNSLFCVVKLFNIANSEILLLSNTRVLKYGETEFEKLPMSFDSNAQL